MSFNKLQRRIRRCGGNRKFLDMHFRNNFKSFWDFLQKPDTSRAKALNAMYTALLLRKYNKLMPRMNKYTLGDDFASYESLYDESRTTYSRVLPRNDKYASELIQNDPNAEKATNCFYRETFIPEPNQNLSLLIGYYAQWFSHQFFNTVPQYKNSDNTWNYSLTHLTNQPVGFNLSQLYGSFYESENYVKFGTVREKDLRLYENGLMKESYINNQAFPEIVSGDNVANLSNFPFWDHHGNKGKEAFKIPVALANMVPGFAAIHTLFFRNHQYMAKELSIANPSWNDEKLFQTAKMLNMLTCLKITMNDYVANALQTSNVKIRFDANIKDNFFYKLFAPKDFYPMNAIQTEFNFLYRWHQFYPNSVKILRRFDGNINNKDDIQFELEFPDVNKFELQNWNSVDYFKGRIDDKEADNLWLERLLYSSCKQEAGQLTLRNTQPWLTNHVIRSGLNKNRYNGLASYNDYREYFGYQRVQNWEDITENTNILNALKNAYKTVDDIEYYVGIFAEDKEFGGIHGPLLADIGVGFTYTGIFATRLLEHNIVNEKLLSNKGMELLGNVDQLYDLIKLHTKLGNNDLWKQLTFRMNTDHNN